MPLFQPRGGWIEVICGSMFCGKTEELIRRVRRAAIARQHIQVFKPAIDFRYGMDRVASHNGLAWDSEAISGSQQVLQDLKAETTVVAIDEVQFFDAGIVDVCNQLAQRGLRVICAGLDQDFRGEPFGPMPAADVPGRDPRQAPCHLCGLRRAGEPHPTADRRPARPLRRPDHCHRCGREIRGTVP